MSYSGPGDVTTFSAWVGLRAYSLAAIGSNCCRLIRASDSTQQDFVTLASGEVDLPSITTFLASTTGKIVTLYDQTGNGQHVTNATDAARPAFNFNVINGHPAALYSGAQQLLQTTLTVSQPFAFAGIANWTGNTSNPNGISGGNGAGDIRLDFRATNVLWVFANNSPVTQTAVAGTFRRVQALISGASSFAYVDGSAGSTGNAGSANISGWRVGEDSNADALTGYIGEMGVISGTPSGTVMTNLDSNMQAWWFNALPTGAPNLRTLMGVGT